MREKKPGVNFKLADKGGIFHRSFNRPRFRQSSDQKSVMYRGGGVLPCTSLIGMCLPEELVGFLRRFGLKTGIHFAHFGEESGMFFEGTTGVY